MYASLIIFTGLMVGGLSYGQFGDAVSLFREEIESNHAWGSLRRRTVESVLDDLESCYYSFESMQLHNAKEINLLISHEYHMYSIIYQDISLRTDSKLVAFLKSDLYNLLDTLFHLCNGTPCYNDINTAKTSLTGPFNYPEQSNNLQTVSKHFQ